MMMCVKKKKWNKPEFKDLKWKGLEPSEGEGSLSVWEKVGAMAQ